LKTIGLLGGMSWESTVTYYKIINETIKNKLGGLHSAKCILYSVDFEEIEACQHAGEWEKSGEILSKAAKGLEMAGADFIIICTNTMHIVSIPVLHIAELTAQRLIECNIKKVGLLGTKYTMEKDFYKYKLKEAGIDVIVPDIEGRECVNSIIYNELCLGRIEEDSKLKMLKIIEGLKKSGAQGVILGCTEIGLLVKQEDTDIPLFDTTMIHAERAALYSIE